MEVVIGIVTKDNKVLMIERVKKEGNLVWAFPGGKLENGESMEEACIREVKEETNIDISIIEKLGSRKHPDTNINMTYFLCEYKSGEIKILNYREISNIEFKTKKELYRDIKTDIFTPVDNYIKKYIK